MRQKTVLITGVAGFIGSHLAQALLTKDIEVVGVDNLTENYPREYKLENIRLLSHPRFTFYETDILDKTHLAQILKKAMPTSVIHLAALTGVRKSLSEPALFWRVNTLGTKLLYQLAAILSVRHFIFASSSSVYGKGLGKPFRETQRRRPRSPYAISKRDAEDVLSILHRKYHLPTTIFRFFSVYGPRGRPDMAPYLFTEAAYSGKQVTLFGRGDARRDFTYVSDVVTAFEKALDYQFDFEIFNIGNTSPISVSQLIQLTEIYTKKRLTSKIVPEIPQESLITNADIRKAKKFLDWQPRVRFTDGFQEFVKWFRTQRL